MKTIRIYLEGNFQDGYLYGGQLFLIQNDGQLKAAPLWDIISKNLDSRSDEYNFFRFIFSQNNWLKNEQSVAFLGIPGFRESFDKLWNRFSKIQYSFNVDDQDCLKSLQQLDSTPTFDMTIYGMRMFIGNRNGLYESGFSISNTNEVRLNEPLQRVFDSRTTNISAKSGSVMISSNSDGLFHGQLTGIGERLKVKSKPISEKSVRSGWCGYDVLNYETQNNFDYLKSEFSKTSNRQYLFRDEIDNQKISIDNVGAEIYSMHDLLSNSRISEENIIYSFNSSTYCFMFLNDGSFNSLSFRKDDRETPVKLSSRIMELPSGLDKSEKITKPVSSKIVPGGCVIEYFDKVILIHNNKRFILEDKPAIAVNTYPGSIRYKNLITIFDGDGVSIHSMYPF